MPVLRNDGTVHFYEVQARTPNWRANAWDKIDLGAILFAGLDYTQSSGELGDLYRSIIEPASAMSTLWQRYGIGGFVRLEDAKRALNACRDTKSRYGEFRIVLVAVSQITKEVDT